MKRTKTIGVAATVLVVLSGCAAMHAYSTQQHDRNVNVTASGTNGCTIANDIAPVNVNNKNNANIKWQIQPASDFKFTNDGIKFVAKGGGGLPAAGQLDKTNSSDTTWNVHDKNTQAGTFNYEVNVVRKAGGTPCKLDPTVVNDGTCTGPDC